MPNRYRAFLAEAQYAGLPFLHLRDGYVTGCFKATFDDADYLCSIETIGEDYGIDDAADIDWYLFEQEGWMPYPLAASLDDFLAGRAWSGADPAPHDNLGEAFSAFCWTEEIPDDDDDDDDD